jgi:DNA processing protein
VATLIRERGAAVPVRPPRPVLEEIVRTLAIPRQGRDGLSAAEAQKADGWARTALATIERARLHVLTPDMDVYPEAFHHLTSPPHAVFAAGRLELLRTPLVAIVGTRSCTAQGRATAARIASGIADANVTIVSGLALGIDGAAHRAAGPARTIAVLGCGVDVAYPPQHRALQRDIARHGLLLSEQLPGAPAAGFHFPLRNRLIAALAMAVVVIEAPERSGALSTARNALDLGRSVFAVPGPLGGRTTEGSNRLIRDGGILITSAREVLETLRIPVPVGERGKDDDASLHAGTGRGVPDRPAQDRGAPDRGATDRGGTGPSADEEDSAPSQLFGVGLALWRSLGPAARHVDDLAADLGLDPQQSLASLLALEVQGFARQLPGMRFVRG